MRYHRVCYSNYTKFLTRQQKIDGERALPVYEESFENVCEEVIKKEIIRNKQIRYLQDLLKKFVNIVEKIENVDASNYRSHKLKQRLQKKYPELVFCTPKVRNVSEIVFVENLTSMELVEGHMKVAEKSQDEGHDSEEEINFDNKGNTDLEADELKILYNAATIIRQKIQDNPNLNLPWPPLASDLTQENAYKTIPPELFNFLAWICSFSSEPTIKHHVPTTDRENAMLLSVAQDIGFYCIQWKKSNS